jgi:RND family efflux transporter MFP subunit
MFVKGAALFLQITLISLLVFLPLRGSAAEIEAVTKPSADIELSFARPGRIGEVLVKEGEAVKAGQLLARQEDKVEQIQLLQLMAKAENRTKIGAAEAELLQKKEDLKKIEEAKKKGAATDWEVEHARLNVEIGQHSLQLARFEHEQDRRKYEEIKAEVERMRLVSPINGLVEDVTIEPGQTAQPLKTAIRVVAIDPLRVDVLVPAPQAERLKANQPVYVYFPSPSAGQTGSVQAEGRITFVSAFSRAGSNTLRVRLEVPNQALRPAGERVSVSFTASGVISSKEN